MLDIFTGVSTVCSGSMTFFSSGRVKRLRAKGKNLIDQRKLKNLESKSYINL